MTLFQLAANGDADAAMLAKGMGLTHEATQDSANTTALPEQVLGGTIMLESRYRTMANLAKDSGHTLVDLPCGYTPRSIEFAREGLPYYGLDLPVVIREISKQVKALLSSEELELIAVAINCGRLDYVSSAGLRVIMIMRKACPGGVTLSNPNEPVTEVLNQTGFAAVLTII